MLLKNDKRMGYVGNEYIVSVCVCVCVRIDKAREGEVNAGEQWTEMKRID